jgi:hypothetical protein
VHAILHSCETASDSSPVIESELLPGFELAVPWDLHLGVIWVLKRISNLHVQLQ